LAHARTVKLSALFVLHQINSILELKRFLRGITKIEKLNSLQIIWS